MMNGIHVQIEGAGDPVVLLAGLSGNGSGWSDQISRFATGYRTIVPDHPGVGGSRRWTTSASDNTPPPSPVRCATSGVALLIWSGRPPAGRLRWSWRSTIPMWSLAVTRLFLGTGR